jgi:hypothetical protein
MDAEYPYRFLPGQVGIMGCIEQVRSAGRFRYDEGKTFMLDTLNKASFDKHIQTVYTVRFSESAARELELVATSGSKGNGVESFSLIFRCSDHQVYPQRIYTLDHPAMGIFDLFLVPVKGDAGGVYYEAVFTRLTPHQTT